MSTYTMIKDKACRFLFSCFLYRAYKADCDKHIGYELLARWNLEENGREAYYLNLLYKRSLNLDLVHDLFKQSMIYQREDYFSESSMFSHLSYGEYEEQPKDYIFLSTKWFYKELKGFNNIEEIDRTLGWPKGTASVFFPHMYEKPLAKSIQELDREIGLSNWLENEQLGDEKISLQKMPIECPFCHSKHTVQVLVGMPSGEPDPEKVYVYGCCVMKGVNPPNWYCRDCHSEIWRGITREQL